MKPKVISWSLVVASNDDVVLGSTLLASPSIDSKCQVIVKRGFASAAKAYNAGLAEALNDIVVFAHQDVYLPETWLWDLERALQRLAQEDPNWGALGVFGVAMASPKKLIGHCYSTGLGRMLGSPFSDPLPVSTLDELLLVIRRGSELSFDEALPGFHLYASDLCLQAEQFGMQNYVIPAFCIHNSNGLKYFPLSYWQAYLYMRRKWWKRLPLETCCVTLTKWYGAMLAQMAFDIRSRLLLRPAVGRRREDLKGLYESLHSAKKLSFIERDPTLKCPDHLSQLEGHHT